MEHYQSFPLKVYYADTDSADIVYYGTYMRWMEMGRCEFFSRHGFDLSRYHEQGSILVVARANLNYQRPARLGDSLNMLLWVTELAGYSFKFNYRFLRQGEPEATTPLVEAQTLMVCVDRQDFRLQPMPPQVLSVLEQYSGPQ